MRNGFAATTTRDIAQLAASNRALLPYYYPSKEKLFAIILDEQLTTFLPSIGPILDHT